ncbi:MAG: EthD family reductase [Acidimicrobiia bacterium]
MLELVALGSDPDAARTVAQTHGGTAYLTDKPDPDRPFASMVRLATADPDALAPAADLGLYLCYVRTMRRHPEQWRHPLPTPGVVAVFGMVRKDGLTHAEADAHWRDIHAPLALRHHPGMWDYRQCSVVRTFAGVAYDGFALCAFGSRTELKERFFDGPEGQEIIRQDVAIFADGVRSPKRVLAQEWRFG